MQQEVHTVDPRESAIQYGSKSSQHYGRRASGCTDGGATLPCMHELDLPRATHASESWPKLSKGPRISGRTPYRGRCTAGTHRVAWSWTMTSSSCSSAVTSILVVSRRNLQPRRLGNSGSLFQLQVKYRERHATRCEETVAVFLRLIAAGGRFQLRDRSSLSLQPQRPNGSSSCEKAVELGISRCADRSTKGKTFESTAPAALRQMLPNALSHTMLAANSDRLRSR